MLKKQAANIITSIRIILAIILVFFTEINTAFKVIYAICGLTDFIDGPIARHFEAESILGSTLDSVGDIILYFSAIKLYLTNEIIMFLQLFIFAMGMSLHVVAAIFAKFKFGKMYFVHNLLSKIIGFMLFVLPFFVFIVDSNVYFNVLTVIAYISGLESLAIVWKSKEENSDVLSILQLFKKC